MAVELVCYGLRVVWELYPWMQTMTHLGSHARAHILRLIGGTIFSDKSSHFVNLMFLPLLEELEQAGEYSWGSAALGWLYRDLCRATVPTAHEIGGFLILLQVWAWDRFPYIAPLRRHLHP